MRMMAFKRAALLLLTTFVVNISFSCEKALEEEGDTHVIAKCSRIECKNAHLLPSDILHEIFSFLPFKDRTSSSLTCKRWQEVHQDFLQAFVRSSTLNGLGLGREVRRQYTISQFPKAHVQRALLDLMAKDEYVSLCSNTFTFSYLPSEFTLLQVKDTKQHLEMTEEFYSTVFGKELLNQDVQEAALYHLLATYRIYFHQDDKDENIKNFFRNKKERFIHHLKEQADIQPYVSFESIPNDRTSLANKAHNIVVIDTQFANEDYKNKLEDLLKTNSAHRFILSVGKGKFVKNDTLRITSDYLPSNVQHLSLVNPQENIITIGDYFLCNYMSLTSFDASGLTNVTTIGKFFLSCCGSLISLDTSGFTNVTTILDRFLYRCESLTSFNVSGLTNITKIGDGFLSGCRGLSREDIEKIRHFLESKDIQWR